MQEPRRQSNTSNAGSVSDIDQPQVQPAGGNLKSILTSPIMAALLTAATSLVIFTFNQVKSIDARLDELEKEARLLLTPEGSAAASEEALEAYFGLQALRERMKALESRLHFHGTTTQ
jgi:hypothetical protein